MGVPATPCGRRSKHHRHFGRRWRIAAAPAADQPVDHHHADAGNIAQLHAFQQRIGRRVLCAIHEDQIGGTPHFDQSLTQIALPRGVAGRKTESDFSRDIRETRDQRDHPQNAERLHAGTRRAIRAENNPVRTLQFDRMARGEQGDPFITVVNDLQRAARLLAQIAYVPIGQRGMAAVDVADHVRVGSEHHVPIDQARAGNRRATRVNRALNAVLAGPRHHLCGFLAALHTAQTDLTEQLHARFRKLLEVLFDHALLDHWRARHDLHAATDTRAAHPFERTLRGNRERLDAEYVFRTPRQVHFAGGDHGRHATVQIRLDPAHLILPRRPVAEHRMHVGVDQARRDRGAFAVDRGSRALEVTVFLPADRDDHAVVDHQRVRIENRFVDVAG
ncbi:hypothetical protein KCU90_g5292, partial [Aureobasidium melanogenum]